MSKDLDAFLGLLQTVIDDRYLDQDTHRDAIRRASDYGLSASEAEHCVLAVCLSKGTMVERLAKEDFRDRVRIAIGDRFLEAEERLELERVGTQLFAAAPLDALEISRSLIHEVVGEEQALTEDVVLEKLRESLGNSGGGGATISRGDWEKKKAELINWSAGRGVDLGENDMESILEAGRRASGVSIATRKTPTYIAYMVGFLPLLLTLAGFGWWLGRGGETIDPSPGLVAESPACDAECGNQLMGYFFGLTTAVARKNYNGSQESVRSWYQKLQQGCAAYDRLEPSAQAVAVKTYPDWAWCKDKEINKVLDGMVQTLLGAAAAAKARGDDPCAALALCLEIIPRQRLCLAAQEGYHCPVSP